MSVTSPSSLASINEISIENQSIYPCLLELRVSSLDRALKFFTEILSFRVIAHEEYDEATEQSNNQSNPADQSSPRSTRYSVTDVAPALNSDFRFRLRFNYQAAIKPSLNHSETGLRHVELQIPGALSRAKVNGYKTNTENGQPIVYGPDELPLLFNEMGGGMTPNNSFTNLTTASQPITLTAPVHRRGSIDAASPSSGGQVINPVVTISFWTRDLEATYAFYKQAFGLKVVESETRRSDSVLLAFDDPQQPMIEFVQFHNTHELCVSKDLQLSIAGVNRNAIDAVAQRANVARANQTVTLTDPDQRTIKLIEKSSLTASGHVIIDWQWRIKHGSGEHSSQHSTPRGGVRKMDESFDDNQFEAGGDNDKFGEDPRLNRKTSV